MKFKAKFTDIGAVRRLLRPGTEATYTSTEVLDGVTYAHNVEVAGRNVGTQIPIDQNGDYQLEAVGDMPEPIRVRYTR